MVSTDILKAYPFFRGLTEEQLQKVAAISEEETYRAGTQMYKKGDPAAHLYIVTEGKVILVMESFLGTQQPPLQVTVDVITQGEAMGWSGAVEPYVFTLGALCIDDTKLIAIDAVKVRALMAEDCDMGFKLMQGIAKVIAQRLTHTRIILVGERGLSHMTNY